MQIQTSQLQFLMEDLVKKLNHSLIATASRRRSFPGKVTQTLSSLVFRTIFVMSVCLVSLLSILNRCKLQAFQPNCFTTAMPVGIIDVDYFVALGLFSFLFRMFSSVVSGLAVHSVAGSILLWGHFPVEGIFSLGVNMGSNSIPPKTLSDESINRGLVCAHMHFIARTQKILTFMS